MSEKRFSREHEWVELDGDIAIIGITEYAVGELGDIIYVELPEIGTRVEAGEKLAVVESVAHRTFTLPWAASWMRSTRSSPRNRRCSTRTLRAQRGSPRCASATPPSSKP